MQCNPFAEYGAFEPDLFYTEIFLKVVINAVLFLTLFQIIEDLLEKQDCEIFKKATSNESEE